MTNKRKRNDPDRLGAIRTASNALEALKRTTLKNELNETAYLEQYNVVVSSLKAVAEAYVDDSRVVPFDVVLLLGRGKTKSNPILYTMHRFNETKNLVDLFEARKKRLEKMNASLTLQ